MLTLADANNPVLIVAAVALIVVLIVMVVLFQFLAIYIRAAASGAPVSMADLIGMRLRKVDSTMIVNCHVLARRAGLQIGLDDLQLHFLAGGNVQRVVLAMIAANKTCLELSWKTAAALDLAGRDVLDQVRAGRIDTDLSPLNPL